MGLSKIEIITNDAKVEKLQKVLEKEEVNGITVAQVLGCGKEKGAPEYAIERNENFVLLPKQQVSIFVDSEKVNDIIESIKLELYTGHIGDGKIFVYSIDNVVRIRTGEEGLDAL